MGVDIMPLRDALIRHILRTQTCTCFTQNELENKTVEELKKENLMKYILHKSPSSFTYEELKRRAINDLSSIYTEIKSENEYAIK
jgi:hypothetical protein